ncbi:MAG: 2-dehydropantoate 2-reductase [Desulfomonile tiedjei]|nr:2-dehydropantoate 2-reductase [Desulfomonile tiedjei]
MRIAVVGVGGVGGYFGGRLAQSGQDVAFIARGKHLEALKTHGLTLDDPEGGSVTFTVKATDNPSEIGQVDAIILGVKAWQVADAAALMQPMIGSETFVLPLQNGVEAPLILSENLGPRHVFGGLCYIVSLIIGPGHIRHVGMKPYLAFGELENRLTERSGKMLDAFRKAGINAEIPGDIAAAMWQKFLFIASVSGLGAVTRAPVRVVRSIPETRALLQAAIEEVAAVALARGVALKQDAVSATLAVVDSLPGETTASMQRDIMDGRPSELDYQSGSVVRLGADVGTPTPVHSHLYAALLPMELRARGEVQF